jgi:chromate reductase
MTLRIVTLCGSFRAGSLNRLLLAAAAKEAERLGAEVDPVDLRALELPIYDGDVEAKGAPAGSVELKRRIAAAQGVLIASPEYNHSIPGGLKNALDWASRPPNNPFRGKVVAVMGASAGHFGTVRMQAHLRQSLTALGAWLVPSSVLLPNSARAFGPDGALVEEVRQKELAQVVGDLWAEMRRHAPSAS